MRDIVVFDFGGVLFDWNPRYLYRELFDGDDAAMEAFFVDIGIDAWNARQDAGRPWSEAVAEHAALHPRHAPMIHAFHAQWPKTLAGEIPGSVAVLRELKAIGTPLYGLTNWSHETFPVARERFDALDLFDGIVVSGEEGTIKPDEAIFRILLQRYALPAERVVFIDDNLANIDTARRLGLHAIPFTHADALRRELVVLGLLPA
jgi:2-haloacid dehalogenase